MENGDSMVREGLLYLIGGLLNKLLPFLVLPVLTLYLTPAELGKAALFQSIYQFLLPLLAFGALGLLSVDIIKLRPEKIASVVRRTMSLQWISALCLLAIVFIFRVQITAFTELSPYLILLLPLACMGGSLINLLGVVLQMSRRVKSFIFLQFSGAFLEVMLITVLIIIVSLKAEGRVLSVVTAAILVGGFSCMFLISRYGRPGTSDFIHAVRLVKLSAPLLVYELAFLVVLITDKLVMRSMHGFSDLGIYSVGLQFGLVVSLFETSLLRAWLPWFFSAKHSGTSDDERNISRYSLGYIGVLVIATVIWIAVSGLVLATFVSSKFESASGFIPWISIGFLFVGIYKLLAQHLFYKKDVFSLMMCALLVALLNVPLTIVLSLFFGPVGVAQATMLSYFFACVVISFIVWRSNKKLQDN